MFSFDHLPSPCLMGIVNVTPDSFSDGGKFFDPHAAAAHARELWSHGAGIVDFGAEASSFFRAGVESIPAVEQLRRLVPVLEEISADVLRPIISVDTRSAEVAEEVLARGVWIINDISAGTHEPDILKVIAKAQRSNGAGVILMHMGSEFPATPPADDTDIVGTVRAYLGTRIQAAMEAGISADRIAIDPGVGFGKTMADNWRLALRAVEVRPAGFAGPIVLGASRKRFLETKPPSDVVLPDSWPGMPAGEHSRDAASAAVTAVALSCGVEIHRVHNLRSADLRYFRRPEILARWFGRTPYRGQV